MSWVLIVQRILLDLVLHVFLFPLWWYTSGAKKVLFGCMNLIQHANRQFAPGLWAKNLFVPMFGQRDWQGRIMSFFMRLVNIIFRSLILALWTFFVSLLFLLWILIPFLITSMIVVSLTARLSSY